jgi:hypothetical protein
MSFDKMLGMSEAMFSFDLNGFCIVRNALTEEEVKLLNDAIDIHSSSFCERNGGLRNSKHDTVFSGDGRTGAYSTFALTPSNLNSTGRYDLGGMLGWKEPQCDPFRALLVHKKLVPFLHAFVGHGYRLDHSPLVILQKKGSEGFSLHGGPLRASGQPNYDLQYRCFNGAIHTNLIAMSVQLTDQNRGDGGFCIVRGSHKMNFPLPPGMGDGITLQEHVHQPKTKVAGLFLFKIFHPIILP